jgi:hypothetical protein
MNNIPGLQNSAAGLDLMKARQATYASATTFQTIQLLGTVLLPVVAAITALLVPSLGPYTATVSILILVLDAAFIERWLTKKMVEAACYSEAFDCLVLSLPWNSFVAGPSPLPEHISRAARSYPGNEASMSKIKNWYPIAVGRAPLEIARLACQRTNLWYDSELRSRYADWVLFIPVILTTVFFGVGLFRQLSLGDLMLAVGAPSAPLLLWAIREHFKQRDTAASQHRVMADVESLWQDIQQKHVGFESLATRSRDFQDAILQRRRSAPLLFPLVYHLMRPSMEQDMNKGAEARLSELGY